MITYFWFLLLSSAILYAVAFIFSPYCWWLVFIFPIPFLYVAAQQQLSFIHGFVWGLSTLILHMFGGVCVVTSMATGHPVAGFCIAIGTILFFAFVIGILCHVTFYFFPVRGELVEPNRTVLRNQKDKTFVSFDKLRTNGERNERAFTAAEVRRSFTRRRESCRSIRTNGGKDKSIMKKFNFWRSYKTFAATVFLLSVITFLDKYCLSIFDVVEGYPLLHPLMVLVHYPPLLSLLPIIGKQWLLLLLLLLPATIVILFFHTNKRTIAHTAIVLLLLMSSIYYAPLYYEKPAWLLQIKPLPYMLIAPLCTNFSCEMALREIAASADFYEENVICITPESSMWYTDTSSIPTSLHCIVGASRMHNNHCYNSLLYIKNGAVIACFDKGHAMLLSERLCFCLQSSFVNKMFFGAERYKITTSSVLQRPLISIEGVIDFVPYICSEFFFTEYSNDAYQGSPVLVIVNDSVFTQYACSSYIARLLLLHARFKAMLWQRPIVYISYTQSCYCGKNGEFALL